MSARTDDGHWIGQLSASALSTATAISALSFYLDARPDVAEAARIEHQIACGINWLKTQQNNDGGWGDTGKNYSNISTTMLVIAALHAAGRNAEFESELSQAQVYVDAQGGISGLRQRYGRDKTFAVPILANCAMAGIVSWKEVSALPFEAACVPQRFYNLMQLPVVSYAIPALVAIGQVKFHFDPPWNPVHRWIRKSCIQRSLQVLKKMQPASGGYLEAVPLTSFVSMGLIKSGESQHAVVENGIRFLLDSYCDEGELEDSGQQGSWPIDTNLATWNTTLAINALSNRPHEFRNLIRAEPERWSQCLDWVIACQNTSVHPFTGAAPGGWGWSDLSGAVPDADDTPGALIALKHLHDLGDFDESAKRRIRSAARLAVDWLINLQNRDNGWPTFCRGWGKLPFDRSGSDITAHAIRGLIAWKDEFDSPKLDKAVQNGFRFIARQQQSDGSWLPLWFGNQDQPDDINPCYGTSKVLMAYREADSFDTKEAEFGLRWLVEHQNSDGGWGGGVSVRHPDNRLGTSSVEETSLCVEALLSDSKPPSRIAAERGIQWLMIAAESGQLSEYSPIGFYFAKLWYYEKMYPLIFATSALGRRLEGDGQK